jgi:RNA-directed DNA polymerase
MTGPEACRTPAVAVIARINAHVRGWGAYFGKGYPGKAFRRTNGFARDRLYRHLRRRSQRPYRPPEGVSWTEQLYRLGLVPLPVPRPAASR